MIQNNAPQHDVDVIICGGGFAGQTLARQLKLNHPELSILIMEKAAFPVEEATHKVGESTVDASAMYLVKELKLKPYLEQHHFPKLGFRYFWQQNGSDSFSNRVELGLSDYFPFYAYQLDRGRFENDLCQMNIEMGVELLEEVSVVDITLNDNDLHEVSYKHLGTKTEQTVRGRWVIDAMGRRCLLQKKLGLQIKSQNPHSAVWFRIKGRLDLTDLVPASNEAWHQRVPNRERYFSTIHLMGEAYWIWLIPLASGYTSVGIVTSEAFHPFQTYSTYDRAIAWLGQHDPQLCDLIQDYEVVDFLKLRHYSYSSKQIFSKQRWACIGDAALFADPFYSPGAVIISHENDFITRMIGLDQQDKLTKDLVAYYNEFVIGVNNGLTMSIQNLYPYFGNSQVFSLGFIWNIVAGWGINGPQGYNLIHLDPEKIIEMERYLADSYNLMGIMGRLFNKWSPNAQGRFSFDFLDYRRISVLEEIAKRRDIPHDSVEALQKNMCYAIEKVEEFAQTIFLLMVEDLMPEKLTSFPQPIWLNTQAMSLDPERWEEDGLFEPTRCPRDLTEMIHQTRSLFRFEND